MSNEKVNCVLLIGCGLSLEGVAGVDQEDLLEKWVLRLGLKRLQSFSNEGTRTSLGVQHSWMSSGYASGLPMQEVPLQCFIIESISTYNVAQEKYIKCRYRCDQSL